MPFTSELSGALKSTTSSTFIEPSCHELANFGRLPGHVSTPPRCVWMSMTANRGGGAWGGAPSRQAAIATAASAATEILTSDGRFITVLAGGRMCCHGRASQRRSSGRRKVTAMPTAATYARGS